MIREYECKKCKHTFEKIEKYEDPPEKDCPKCMSKNALVVLISNSTFHLKGIGWYTTGGY